MQIVKDGDSIRIREGSGPLKLRCVLTGDVSNIQARWLTPNDVGRTDIMQTHDGRELILTLDEPKITDSGRFVCQAARVSDTINAIIEPVAESKLLNDHTFTL